MDEAVTLWRSPDLLLFDFCIVTPYPTSSVNTVLQDKRSSKLLLFLLS